MRRIASVMALWFVSLAALGHGQAPPQPSVQGQPPYVGPATETITPDIPGVVKGGTKVQIVKEGFQATEGPLGLPDGSLLFCEGEKITKIDKAGNASLYLDNTNGANGLGYDSKGRLVAALKNGV